MRRKRRRQGEVELNLAAMLDMAFQLLTFFILTFRPAPIEGQLKLHLPPPTSLTNMKSQTQAGADTANKNPVAGLGTLVVSIFPSPSGKIATLAVGDAMIPTVSQLEKRLQEIFAEPTSPFDQVILQVGSEVRYEEVMRVLDACTRQKLANGQSLSKLSFVELPSSSATR
jgi:biopolymer transport protein ExbD